MGKVKKCVGKEGFQRINYLYQLANLQISNAHFYSNLAVNISKKTVQRLDLNIKRSICKGCRALLIAGVTCTVRLRKKKLMWTCSVCNTVRTYNVSTKHQLWLDHPDSVVETLNYETNNL